MRVAESPAPACRGLRAAGAARALLPAQEKLFSLRRRTYLIGSTGPTRRRRAGVPSDGWGRAPDARQVNDKWDGPVRAMDIRGAIVATLATAFASPEFAVTRDRGRLRHRGPTPASTGLVTAGNGSPRRFVRGSAHDPRTSSPRIPGCGDPHHYFPERLAQALGHGQSR
jgi:hypothetical protein